MMEREKEGWEHRRMEKAAQWKGPPTRTQRRVTGALVRIWMAVSCHQSTCQCSGKVETFHFCGCWNPPCLKTSDLVVKM